MNVDKLLEKRESIYGICAIWIVLFHTFRRISMPYIPIVTDIIAIGNLGVDIFFFYSGLCLSLSSAKHNYACNGWRDYFRRRFSRILVPYLLICIPYYIWNAIVEVPGSVTRKTLIFFFNFSSASFWLRGMQTTWYVYGILLYYLVFPLLYKFAVKHGASAKCLLLAAEIIFAVASAYVPVLKQSMILWSRLPVFSIGIMIGTENQRENLNAPVIRVVSALVLIGLAILTSRSELSASFTIPPIYRFLLYLPMTVSLMLLLPFLNIQHGLFDWLGKHSLEIYLIHITLLHPIKHYGILRALGYWLYLLLPMIAIAISALVGVLERPFSYMERKA